MSQNSYEQKVSKLDKVTIPTSFITLDGKTTEIVIQKDFEKIINSIDKHVHFFIEEKVFKSDLVEKTIISNNIHIRKFDRNTLYDVAEVCAIFAQLKIKKDNEVVIIGGKSFIDIFGFASSIYMSGLTTYIIPATLYSMSEIGGKYCLDASNATKYDIELKFNPKRMFICPRLAIDRDEDNFSAGLLNIMRYGILSNLTIFNKMHRYIHIEKDKRTIDEYILIDILDDVLRTRIHLFAFESNHATRVRDMFGFGMTTTNILEILFPNQYSFTEKLAIGLELSIGLSKLFNQLSISSNQLLNIKTFIRVCVPNIDSLLNNDILQNEFVRYIKGCGETLPLILINKIGEHSYLREVPVLDIEKVIKDHEPLIF